MFRFIAKDHMLNNEALILKKLNMHCIKKQNKLIDLINACHMLKSIAKDSMN